ncbi:MAG: SRPBCC family protein [Halobacteriales archaeon]|nr:SRPBCC family protein [Halobacteriales archaeon]
MEIRNSVVIDRRVEDVWHRATDLESWPEWNSQLVTTEVISEGPVRPGTKYRYTARAMGRNTEHESEITQFDPPRRICFRTPAGAMPLEGCYVFEAQDGGTLVTISAEGTVKGVLRFAEPIIERLANRMWKANLGRLRDDLEAST